MGSIVYQMIKIYKITDNTNLINENFRKNLFRAQITINMIKYCPCIV